MDDDYSLAEDEEWVSDSDGEEEEEEEPLQKLGRSIRRHLALPCGERLAPPPLVSRLHCHQWGEQPKSCAATPSRQLCVPTAVAPSSWRQHSSGQPQQRVLRRQGRGDGDPR